MAQARTHFSMCRGVRSFMANVTHQIFSPHLWWQATHQVASLCDTSTLPVAWSSRVNFVQSPKTSNVTSGFIEVEEKRWDYFFQLFTPQRRAIDIFEIHS